MVAIRHTDKQKDQLTREAMADVDAGRVIDHEAVLAWAESLGSECPLSVPNQKMR